MKYKRKKSLKVLIMKGTDYVGLFLAWAVLFAHFCVLPLYMKTAYEQIATNKYLCFMNTSRYLIYAILSYFIVWLLAMGLTGTPFAFKKNSLPLDVCILFLFTANLISVLCSKFRFVREVELNEWYYEGTLWGTKGWYMGFMTMLIIYIFYFYLSRNLKITKYMFLLPFSTVTFVSLFGIVNRFGWNPLADDYGFDKAVYLSTMGNMNWLSGYTAILFPLIWGYTWGMQKKTIRLLFAQLSVICFGMVLLNGSDSGVLGLCVMLAVLFCISIADYEKLVRFFELLVMLFSSAVVIWSIDLLVPTLRLKNLGVSEKLFSPLGLLLCLIVIILYLGLKTPTIEAFVKKHPVKRPQIFAYIFIGIVACVVLLIAVNTKTGHGLPIVGDKEFFYFDNDWGSNRGATWTIGLKAFGEMGWFQKFFGTGMDGFYFEMSQYAKPMAISYEVFGNARLTNAHNEFISLLVNDGLLGTLGYIALLATSFVMSIRMARQKKEYIGFALMVASLVANNFFSFRTISSTPLLFYAIAMQAAILRAEFVDKKGV